MEKKKRGKVTKKIDSLEFEVAYNDDRLFTASPRKKKETLQMLKMFVYKECGNAWKLQPKNIVTLKKQFLYELIDALEN